MTTLRSPRSLDNPNRRPGWTAGRIVSAVAGVLLVVSSRYLTGVGYDTVRGLSHGRPVYTGHAGGAPALPPVQAGIWAAHVAGPGTQPLTWPDRSGSWTVIAMNADASRPVAVRVDGTNPGAIPPPPGSTTSGGAAAASQAPARETQLGKAAIMHVFVTGGAGVLGQAFWPLAEAEGHQVRAPRRTELDLFDPRAVRAAIRGADAVLHLATRIPALDKMGQRLPRRRAGQPPPFHRGHRLASPALSRR